jgi:nitrite reductase/ring-hydroxylating ferredoxin subunit
MGTFHRVADTSDLPPGKGMAVQAGEQRVALFNCDGVFHAIGDVCPHRGGPLSDGELDGPHVQCPWHGALFDVRTGDRVAGPSPRGVPCFAVRVTGDSVEVEAP